MPATRRKVTRKRAKPGTKGGGDYFRIEIRPAEEFKIFRYHDVGRKGHVQRLAGKRATGSWDTQAWLIGKKDAHIEGGKLIPDSKAAEKILNRLGTVPKRVKGDVFSAKEGADVPDKKKPTAPRKKSGKEGAEKAGTGTRKK